MDPEPRWSLPFVFTEVSEGSVPFIFRFHRVFFFLINADRNSIIAGEGNKTSSRWREVVWMNSWIWHISYYGKVWHCIGMILCCSIQQSMTQAMFLLRFLDLCARTGREAGEDCRESHKTKRQTVVGQTAEVLRCWTWPKGSTNP